MTPDSAVRDHCAQHVCAIFLGHTASRSWYRRDSGTTSGNSSCSRPFVHDLSPASPVLQAVNEEFPLYSSSIQLFSFYENEPKKLGIRTQMIVEKHCAVMNYPNERRTYFDANHRNVAKFSLPNNPSYLAIKNALAASITSERTSRELANHKTKAERN
jgi:hypothetical protein